MQLGSVRLGAAGGTPTSGWATPGTRSAASGARSATGCWTPSGRLPRGRPPRRALPGGGPPCGRLPRCRAPGGGFPRCRAPGSRLPCRRSGRSGSFLRGRPTSRAAAARCASNGFSETRPRVLQVLLDVPEVRTCSAVDVRPGGLETLLDRLERSLHALERCTARAAGGCPACSWLARRCPTRCRLPRRRCASRCCLARARAARTACTARGSAACCSASSWRHLTPLARGRWGVYFTRRMSKQAIRTRALYANTSNTTC
jgi:hypothetical protein